MGIMEKSLTGRSQGRQAGRIQADNNLAIALQNKGKKIFHGLHGFHDIRENSREPNS